MRFHKHVTEQKKDYLKVALAKYEKEIAMTIDERKDLHKWVASGKDPYSNGHGYSFESGYPMDFIEAEHFNTELCEQYENMTE